MSDDIKLLIKAVRDLAVDSGTVSSPVNAGGNALTDSTKAWAAGVHRNRLVKIIGGSGAGQIAVISTNSANALLLKQAWAKGIDATSVYIILEKDIIQILRDVFGGGSDISTANPLEVHDPKVGSLISYEGVTTANGAGDGSTLLDSVLITKPDYDGNLVIITSGDYAGQARDINGVTTAGTVTPASAFGGQIVSGVTFAIVGIRTVPAEVAALMADVGDASASTLGSLYAILGNPAQSFLAMIGYEGATALADKLTAARAALLDEITAVRMAELDAANLPTTTDNILLDTQVRRAASGSKTIASAATKYLHIDSGTSGAEILAVIIKGVVSADWTLDIYVPTDDAVAGPAAGDKRDSITYVAADTEGGLLKPFAIAYNCFLDFTNDSLASDDIDDVVVVYRSRAALTLAWEA